MPIRDVNQGWLVYYFILLIITMSWLSCRFQEVADLVPLYLCWTGEFAEAMNVFIISSRKSPTLRLSPFFFQLYLHIMETGTGPVLTSEVPTEASLAGAKWEKIEGQTLKPSIEKHGPCR